MAENPRGQNIDGRRGNERENRPGSNQQKNNLESERQVSTNRGRDEMGAQPSMGNRGTTRGSRIVTNRSFSSSDYDGQLSDE